MSLLGGPGAARRGLKRLQRDTFRRAMTDHLTPTGTPNTGARGRPAALFLPPMTSKTTECGVNSRTHRRAVRGSPAWQHGQLDSRIRRPTRPPPLAWLKRVIRQGQARASLRGRSRCRRRRCGLHWTGSCVLGSAPGLVDTRGGWFSGRFCGRVDHLKLGWGEFAEGSLSTSSVVLGFDPDHDRQA